MDEYINEVLIIHYEHFLQPTKHDSCSKPYTITALFFTDSSNPELYVLSLTSYVVLADIETIV